MVVFLWTFRGRFWFQRVEHHRSDSMRYIVCHVRVSEGDRHSGVFLGISGARGI
jgi:hypothetical protein